VTAPHVDAPTASGRTLSAAVTPVAGVAITSCGFTLTPAAGGTGTNVDGSFAAGACTATVPAALADGSYDLVATATDANNQSGSATSAGHITVSGIKPTVALDILQPNRHVAAVVGSPDGETIADCTITATPHAGGAPVTLDETLTGTQCSAGLLPRASFPAGDYDVTVTVTDQSGDTASDGDTITVATPHVDPPTASGRTLSATITPADGVAIASCSFALTAVPNGTPKPVTGSYADGTCTATVPTSLADGSYDINASALDANFDSGTAASTGHVAISGIKPTVTLDGDQPNRHVSAAVGSPDGETITACTITATPHGGGTPVTLDETLTDTHCSADLARAGFPAGDYDVTVMITDQSGDSATDSGTVTIATPHVDAPTAGNRSVSAAVTPAPDVAISSCSFTLTPVAGGDAVTVDGSFAAGACTATVPATLADGNYDLTASATDANGDSGSGSGHGTVSGTKPTVTLDGDQPNRVVSATVGSPDGETIADCTITATPHGGGTPVTLDATLDSAAGTCTAMLPRADVPAGDYDIHVSVSDQTDDSDSTDGTVSVVTPIVAAPQVAGRVLSTAVTPAPGVAIDGCSFTLTPTAGGDAVSVDGDYSAAPSSCSLTLPDTVGDGDYDVVADAVDANGDGGRGSSDGLTVSGTAPTVTLDGDQPNRTISATGSSPDGETLTDCTIQVRRAGSDDEYTTLEPRFEPATGACSATLPQADFPDAGDYEVLVGETDQTDDTGTAGGTITVALPSVGDPVDQDGTILVPIAPASGVPISSCTITITPAGGSPTTLEASYDAAGGSCRATLPSGIAPGTVAVETKVTDANGDTGSGHGTITVPAPVASPTPTPVPRQTDDPFRQGSGKDIVLACTARGVALTNVAPVGKRKVLIAGVVADKYAGKRVKITLVATKKVVATVTAGSTGVFKARIAAPPAKLATTARYTAQVGSDKSTALKLNRRMSTLTLKAHGGTITVRGTVNKPLAKGRQTVTVTQLVACDKYKKVGSAKLDAKGRYSLNVKRPTGVHAALYRASTKVATRADGPARSTAYTLPQPLNLP